MVYFARYLTILFCLTSLCLYCVEAIDDGLPPTGSSVLSRTLHKPSRCNYKVGTNMKIKLHYTARQWNTEDFFENTYDAGSPVSYRIGYDKMMKGLERGIQNMCLHESRRLLIPADLAYGELGLPGRVEPNTAIIMEVELIEVNSPYSNPWFWAGLATLLAIYLAIRRHDQLKAQTNVPAIEKKDQ